VSTGGLNAGVATLGVSVVVTWPVPGPAASGPAAVAEIRNRIVPPGDTLVADAETVTAGVAAWCGLIRPVAEGLGVVGAGEGRWWWPVLLDHGEEGAGLGVPLAVGAAGSVGSVGGLDGAAAGVDGDGDGVTAADDATAMTMTVTPPKMRKKPVARISVTGRARMNRMGTPVIWHRVGRDRALRGIRHIWGHGLALGATNCERVR
jgi:hypothetical protein